MDFLRGGEEIFKENEIMCWEKQKKMNKEHFLYDGGLKKTKEVN